MSIYFASVIHTDGTTSNGIVLAADPLQAEDRVRHFIAVHYPKEQRAMDVAIVKAQEGNNAILVNWVAGN